MKTAIEIVNEEINKIHDQNAGPTEDLHAEILIELGKRITERIEKECIEVPECARCENPADDHFVFEEWAPGPPRSEDLCGRCYNTLREDGVVLRCFTVQERSDLISGKVDAADICF